MRKRYRLSIVVEEDEKCGGFSPIDVEAMANQWRQNGGFSYDLVLDSAEVEELEMPDPKAEALGLLGKLPQGNYVLRLKQLIAEL